MNATRVRNALIKTISALRLSTKQEGIRVVTIHEVKDTSVFKSRMEWLKARYEMVPLEAIFSHSGVSEPGRQKIALTFDDGFDCWEKEALPVLINLNIPATFFVCSGLLGLTGEAWQDYCRNKLHRRSDLSPLSEEGLKKISEHELFEIGGHTCSHVNLGTNTPHMEKEIKSDKEKLEKITGNKIRWFAYPYGMQKNTSVNAIDVIKECGYAAAWTIVPGINDKNTSRYLLHRDSLNVMEDEGLWKAWLSGGYDRLCRFIH